ncbi:MAG TPA: benzoate-CoA ligase family protein [Mycobacteriales bacterium]|jgi:benzoate-CoA ligase family protein|nr:benzoate-CoA ligase family protein [Mycobacteriales bacterium]
MAEAFNAAAYLVDARLAEGAGDRVAVRSGDDTLTYAQLCDLTAAVAASFRALDLRREERVMFVMSDGPELLGGILGAFRAGLIAVPVSTMYNGAELGKILADSGARTLVVTSEFAAAAAGAVAAAPDVAHVIVAGEADLPGAVEWAAFLGLGATSTGAVAPTTEDSPALWLYTSGTTGTPKAAMHRHANIRHVVETYGKQVLAITPDDVCFSVAKMFFAYGIGNSVFFPLSVGASAVLEPRRPSPAVAAEVMARYAPTLFFSGPTFFAAILAADLPADTFASVRTCVSAGEALPPALHSRFTGRFGAEILDGIGSTECLHIFVSNRPGDVQPGTSGVPVPGYDVELRGPDGVIADDEVPGALYVRGASIASGYWCRTDATRAVFQGEWLRTGDTYVRTKEGYYTSLGRDNDLLKAGGIWVSPSEVEDRLLQHPSVAEVVVVGVPDADGLDKPVACVVPAEGHTVDPDALVAFCREGLASFKRPRAVLVMAALPKTATGKMQRYRVREMLAVDHPHLSAAPPSTGDAGGTGVPAGAGVTS